MHLKRSLDKARSCRWKIRQMARAGFILVTWFGLQTTVSGQHRVLLQGNQRLAIVNPAGDTEWEMPWGAIHDLHLLENGHFMLQDGPNRIAEVDPTTQTVVWNYDSGKMNGNEGKAVEVHAFQPLLGERVLIAESGPARIIEIDRAGTLLKSVKLTVHRPNPHRDTRLARRLRNDHYLVCHEGDGCVREYASEGELVWEFDVPLFGRAPAEGHGPESFGNSVFAALRLENGNTLVATGNGHSVLEVDRNLTVVWHLEQRDLPGIVLAWVTTLEILPNGNYLIGNCHAGPENPCLIEIEPKSKKVVWALDVFKDFGNDVSTTRLLD